MLVHTLQRAKAALRIPRFARVRLVVKHRGFSIMWNADHLIRAREYEKHDQRQDDREDPAGVN
jgi:hypothetical protein